MLQIAKKGIFELIALQKKALKEAPPEDSAAEDSDGKDADAPAQEPEGKAP
jgi:hypothetical protein